MKSLSISRISILALAGAALAAPASAQVLDEYYAPFYEITDLGSVPNVPPAYGGVTFKYDDANILLLGGAANSFIADVFQVRVARDIDGHIISFGCEPAAFFCDAFGVTGGIDGGLAFGPGNVLFYTTYADHQIGQVRPGETTPARITAGADLGMAASFGALQFVPPGFPGAGRLKFASYNTGFWYDSSVSPAGDGTYLISPATPSIVVNVGGGPEGMVYIEAGNPQFAVDSVLISEWATGRIVSYEIDANGDPIVETRRVFMTGLSGAEGAAIDPVTGDFLFSTFGGGNRVIQVRGFTSTVSCQGDLNFDRSVSLTDLALLLASFGENIGGDLNGDCETSLADLAILLANFGNVCE